MRKIGKAVLITLTIFLGLAVISVAEAQSNDILTPGDYKQRMPKGTCIAGDNEYIASDLNCSQKFSHMLGADDEILFLFLNGKRNGVILVGPTDKVIKGLENIKKREPQPLEMTENSKVQRWVGSVRAIYLLKEKSEGAPTALIAYSKEAADSLNIRFGLGKSENTLPSINSQTDQNQVTLKSRVDGGVVSLFGIKLAEPLNFVECPKEYSSILKETRYVITFNPTKPCYEKLGKIDLNSGPLVNGRVTLRFSGNDTPHLGVHWMLLIVDGQVEGMVVGTMGINDQDTNLISLKNKFGEPTSFLKTNVKNLTGAQFESFSAAWQAKEFNVTYQATDTKIDNGVLKIYSNVGQAAVDRENAEYKAKNPGREL